MNNRKNNDRYSLLFQKRPNRKQANPNNLTTEDVNNYLEMVLKPSLTENVRKKLKTFHALKLMSSVTPSGGAPVVSQAIAQPAPKRSDLDNDEELTGGGAGSGSQAARRDPTYFGGISRIRLSYWVGYCSNTNLTLQDIFIACQDFESYKNWLDYLTEKEPSISNKLVFDYQEQASSGRESILYDPKIGESYCISFKNAQIGALLEHFDIPQMTFPQLLEAAANFADESQCCFSCVVQ